MADTAIEWAEKVWNPTTGCDRVSPGCDNCYALKLAKRLKGMGSAKYQRDGDPSTSGPGFGLTVHEDALALPLTWRQPKRIFVNSMSDLFHDAVPDAFIAKVFAVMHYARQHTFQLLTKRHGRMRALLSSDGFFQLVWDTAENMDVDGQLCKGFPPDNWPLPNVLLGVSVEDQKWADIRIPALLDTPAAVRWLSMEPLLGPVDLHAKDARTFGPQWLPPIAYGVNRPNARAGDGSSLGDLYKDMYGPNIDWVVVGGESGPDARPMHPDWARSLRDQCTAAGVPFFFKQHGEWFPIGPLYDQDEEGDSEDSRWDAVDIEVVDRKRVVELETTGHIVHGYQPGDPRTWPMGRLGKKAAGRALDGRTWDEYPQAVSG
jgi:protein gp37